MGKRTKIAAAMVALVTAAVAAAMLLRRPVPPRSQWNLLWICIDDFKADHLGAAGYGRDVTPSLDKLARSGVRFEWCVTQAPWSLPSYASMFTSRYPYELVLGPDWLQHVRGETEVARSRDAARMPEMNTHWYVPLTPGIPTLAGVLAAAGLDTGGWVNNAWLEPGTFGLERGFKSYFDGVAHHSPYTPADETTADAIKWIKERRGKRWFAFVHLMDPHRPYEPHSGINYGTRFIDLYDAEIEFTDRAVGGMLDALDRMGLSDHTVIVVNADHGEGVFEEDSQFVGHGGGVIPAIARVPLIMKWPGGPRGRLVGALCRGLDVMPTVLDLLGVPGPEGMEGRSLVPDVRKKARVSPEPAYTMAVLKGPEKVSVMEQGDETDQVFQAVVVPAYQQAAVYSFTPEGWTEEASPEMTARLMEDLTKFVAAAEKSVETGGHRTTPMLDEKTRARLKALGYLQ